MERNLWNQAANKQAIALHYDNENHTSSRKNAPQVTAKGKNELANQMIAIAKEYNIPIFENPALASLLGTLELGDEIPPLLYQTIAELIAFAYSLNNRDAGGSRQ